MSDTVNEKQVDRAVSSLLKYIKSEKNKTKQTLFDVAEYAYLQVGLKKIPEKGKRSVSITLPNPIYQEDSFEICIITKDPQKEYKELFQKAGVKVKVIGVTKLRKNYKAYEAKRKLLGSYDMFLADARILPLLPRLLGKKFFESKKFPIPVQNIDSADLSAVIEDVRNKTHFSFKAGTNFTVRVGKFDQSAKEITQNILAVINELSPLAVDDFNLIQSLHIKSSASVALPIYLSNPIPLLSQPDENAENEELKEEESGEDNEEEEENEEDDE